MQIAEPHDARTRRRMRPRAGRTGRRRGPAVFPAVAVVMLLAGMCAGCGPTEPARAPADHPAAGVAAHANGVDSQSLQKAMALAAGYVIRSCGDDGKFVYRINLDPKFPPKPKYNLLRHAGAIYALAQYERRFPRPDAREALARAAGFLTEAIAPIPRREDMLAVWSRPEVTGSAKGVQIKLGGTGLGLVALLSVEAVAPGTTPMDVLQRMGRFILFMQRQDGSFHSKYDPRTGGMDEWVSLYYPGEAVLGLLMLYERDRSPQWLQAACRGLGHLARGRAGRTRVEPDQWALLATAKLLGVHDARCKRIISRQALVHHAVQICESMLAKAGRYPRDAEQYGCMSADGRTCPTATNLEGLLAAMEFLPAAERPLAERIVPAVGAGMSFLLRCQVQAGRYAGGIPRAIHPLSREHPKFKESFNKRATEVRIDYVQHALSAMIAFDRCFPTPRR